jgi:hypothetical protein
LEEFFDNEVNPIELLGDNPIKFFHKATIVMFPADELREGADRSQGILDLVRHASSHLSQSGKTIGAVQATLQGLNK